MQAIRGKCERALRFLEVQRLPPLPHNYWIAYAFVDGGHAALAAELARILDGGVRITQAEANALYVRFGGLAAEDGAVADPAAAAIRHQARRLAELADTARATTGEFSRALDEGLAGEAPADNLRALFLAAVEESRRAERELATTTGELAQLREQLEAAQGDANRDALTGLPNRRGIEAFLAAIDPAAPPRTVAICDIDGFKAYNDRYGHAVGDRVLRTVAESLRESLGQHFVGRWGGEEFLAVMAGGIADGVALVEAAKDALGDRHFRLRETDEPMGRITFSAGVAALPPEAHASEAAINRADTLLYQAKAAGRDRVIGG